MSYEAPELVELGSIEDVTMGEDINAFPDHCDCDKPIDLWLY